MAIALERLTQPFAPLTEDDARTLLTDTWGMYSITIERLETERDDTFRARTLDGVVTLKVAHPGDRIDVIELQTSALAHVAAADPGIPLQRVVPALNGRTLVTTRYRIARVMTWLEGALLHDMPQGRKVLRDAGTVLGRLNRALSDFEHDAADRELAWDIARLSELRPHASEPLMQRVLDRFEAEVAPVLPDLPHQIVHNDFHPANVLVDARRGTTVTGVLDFGDVVRTARVCDLAVALAYLVPDAPPPWPGVRAFREGFESIVPLSDAERDVLPILVAGRTLMRTVINRAMNPHADDDLGEFYERNSRKLASLLAIGPSAL
ncbi:MAG TPA: phosphotransferase [Pseudolysinimonas sp.]